MQEIELPLLNSGIYCQSFTKGRGRMQKKVIITSLTLMFILFISPIAYAIPSTYLVQAGDSLWKISQNNGVSIDKIIQLNGLSSDRLSIGQTLKLTADNANPPAPVANKVSPINNNADNATVYVVKSGDNLWAIAGQFGTSVERIKELNGLS